jgi:hypothetical protein
LSRYDPPKTAYSEFSCFQHKPSEYPWCRTLSSSRVVDPQRRLDWVPSLDDVKNSYGCIRWYLIRNLYFGGLVDLDFCIDANLEWRNAREDLWLDAINTRGEVIGAVFVVASKRGNEWYKKRVKRKFSFYETLPPVHFFCEEWGHKKTPMLFVTPSVDPELVNYDLNQAWDQISMELHVFETKLRQKYGRFTKIRTWEAHASGFPHPHLVYYFLDHEFEVWEDLHIREDGSVIQRWRVSDSDRDTIQSFWGLSKPWKEIDGVLKRIPSVDIQGVSDTIGALSEVCKYVTKTIWNDKGDLTTTLCSLHNKQAYWISQNNPIPLIRELEGCSPEYILDRLKDLAPYDFVGSIWGVQAYYDFYKSLMKHGIDEGMVEPSECALVNRALHNCNKELPDFDHFEFKGCFLHSDLALMLPLGDDEISILDHPPDDVRAFFGVDRIVLSVGSGSKHKRRFLSEDPDVIDQSFGDGDIEGGFREAWRERDEALERRLREAIRETTKRYSQAQEVSN